MDSSRTARACAIAVLCACGAVSAHHASDSEFDKSKAVALHGVISKVDWVNPHIYVYIDIRDDSGAVTTWSVESAPPAFWRKAGVTRQQILGDGSPVTILANPGKRDPSRHLALLERMTRADGTFIQADAFVPAPDSP